MRFVGAGSCRGNRSGAIDVLLLGIITLLSLASLLHVGVVTLRHINSTWQQLNDDTAPVELLCALPLRELLQEDFDREVLRLPTEARRFCMLPATDYGNRWQVDGHLNVLLCALLDYVEITDFQAWGKTCA